MKGSQIFVNWLLTVIFGSLLIPLLIVVVSGGTPGMGLIIAVIAAVFSSLSSLPTLVALLIVAAIYSDASLHKRQKALNITHIIMGVLTIVVGCIWLYYTESSNDVVQYALVVTGYGVVAGILWYLTYKKEKEKMKVDYSGEGETT